MRSFSIDQANHWRAEETTDASSEKLPLNFVMSSVGSDAERESTGVRSVAWYKLRLAPV